MRQREKEREWDRQTERERENVREREREWERERERERERTKMFWERGMLTCFLHRWSDRCMQGWTRSIRSRYPKTAKRWKEATWRCWWCPAKLPPETSSARRCQSICNPYRLSQPPRLSDVFQRTHIASASVSEWVWVSFRFGEGVRRARDLPLREARRCSFCFLCRCVRRAGRYERLHRHPGDDTQRMSRPRQREEGWCYHTVAYYTTWEINLWHCRDELIIDLLFGLIGGRREVMVVSGRGRTLSSCRSPSQWSTEVPSISATLQRRGLRRYPILSETRQRKSKHPLTTSTTSIHAKSLGGRGRWTDLNLKCGIRDDNFGEGRSQVLPGYLPHRRPRPWWLAEEFRARQQSSVQLENIQGHKLN